MDRLPDLFAAADEQLRDFAATYRRLEVGETSRPTPCGDWDVAALARHVASAAFRQAEAFHRARVHGREAPTDLTFDHAGVDVADVLDAAADHLRSAVASFGEREWPTVPLPFAALPAPLAAAGLVLEYGVHRSDLAVALGAPRPGLSPATARAVLDLSAALLVLIGPDAGPEPVGLDLLADRCRITLGWDGERWSNDVPDAGPTCTIRGSDEVIALLVMRRTGADDPRLEVDDPAGLTDRLPELIGAL